ncbi:hypothetical protein P152DRAFT_307695 [Eremomyces bilateralis CBS 781.70]|uniref:Uncharacterized protein n=1 Tax=Eremomyces bilateralis CBS 781.70 TaxID=1392243 RepID=A0A6G1G546_9PEZI|nr:uncharacterized protein P152DRAFT_307695 [Eremomyces bilateralis CBS 781.70]KAF1813174.1 hypothetical protein P152DRAFT_307695 [Eremomyces bilateralis CBS 781.70]
MVQSRGFLAASMAMVSFCGPLLTYAEAAPAPPNTRDPDRPRYYFPRVVKRQIGNLSALLPVPDAQESDFSGLISNIASDLTEETTSSDAVTTIVVSSTSVFVFDPMATPTAEGILPPSGAAESGTADGILLPSGSAESGTTDGILPPSGVAESGTAPVVPETSETPTSPILDLESSLSNSESDPSSGGGVPSSIILPSLSVPFGGAFFESSTGGTPETVLQPSSTPDPSSETAPSTSESPTGIIVGLSTVISSASDSVISTSASEPSDLATPTSSSGDFLDGIIGSLTGGVFPTGALGTGASSSIEALPSGSESFPPDSIPTSSAPPETTSPPDPGDVISSIASEASSALGDLTSSPTPSESLSEDISSILSSAASEFSGISSSPNPTDPVAPTQDLSLILSSIASEASSIVSEVPPETSDPAFPTSTPDNSTESSFIANPTAPPVSTPTLESTSSTLPTDLPISNSTIPVSDPTGPISLSESPSSSLPVSSSSVSGIVDPSLSATSSATSQIETPSTVVPGPTTLSEAPVFSVIPTGSDTLSTQFVPSSIVAEPTSNTVTLTAVETGIPSTMPKLIKPPGGTPEAPKDSTLVQVGFSYPLNFPFVSSSSVSRRQIYRFLPEGIAFGLKIPREQVVFYALQPYDTTEDLQYITTLALFYVASDKVSQLGADLLSPVSQLYGNPDESARTLMGLINPSIPLLPGQLLDDNRGTGPNNPSASSPTKADGGSAFGGDASSSSPVKSTSVAVGVSAAVGAVLYGGAMVLVARRYKQRKARRHQRTSSVQSGSQEGGPWMTGAGHDRVTPGMSGRQSRYSDRSGLSGSSAGQSGSSQGRSIRTTQISAPVMSENSLGWN